MASVGYGSYNFGIAAYGTPQYQEASATIAQTSGASAIGRQLDRGVATIAQTSGMSAIGTQVDRGPAPVADRAAAHLDRPDHLGLAHPVVVRAADRFDHLGLGPVPDLD